MPADPRRWTVTAALVALAAVSAFTACDGSAAGRNERTTVSGGTGELPAARRNPPTGPVRTDTAPLTELFPGLGQPLSARWLSGTVGSDRAPGPTSYWIDAVVRLRPETAKSLRETADSTSVALPDLAAALKSGLPAGATWRLVRRVDRDSSNGDDSGFGATSYLADGTDTLVLQAIGGN